MKVSVKTTQLLEASVLGTLAFKNGLKRAPFYDTELNKFFAFSQCPSFLQKSTAFCKTKNNLL